jgi:hypothetical protein
LSEPGESDNPTTTTGVALRHLHFSKAIALAMVMLATAIRRDGGGCGSKLWMCSGEPTLKTSIPLQPNEPVDWQSLRADFPILDQIVHGRPLVYFDNAAVHIPNSQGTVNPRGRIVRWRPQAEHHHTRRRRPHAARSAGDRVRLPSVFWAQNIDPTGIGVLYGLKERLADLPSYQGGGDMILNVSFHQTTYKSAPHRFEAGTAHISGPIVLHAAMDYLDAIGRANIWKHDQELASYAYERLSDLRGVRLFGPKTGRGGLVSFLLHSVHAHDVVTVADQWSVALRGGHHCTQPLLRRLGVESTARASFYFYNTEAEVEHLIEVVREIQRFFGVSVA